MKNILSHPCIAAHDPTILLLTPPPINEPHLEEQDLSKGCDAVTRHQAVTAKYAEVVRELSREYKDKNVVLIDLWQAMVNEAIKLTKSYVDDGNLIGTLEKGDNPGLRSLLSDGLHLTAAGYKLFLSTLLPFVGPEWAQEPELSPNWIFP